MKLKFNLILYFSLIDPTKIDWEKFSILDLIKAGEEIWSQFNPTDVECQKRLICEIHQNSGDLGPTAEQIVDWFSYLSYTKVMTMPKKMQKIVNEYLEAADKGLEENVDCGNEYFRCKFSLKKLAKKYRNKKEKKRIIPRNYE
ncbi:hypothetical protein Anas_12661 [Armadillidium nasatum]|uniref:Uncharacterized protein n=1 Tax=Armadillidium nasatum TaxID=96803 RepID=A0A5N5STC4_9CRUS|nr:hypothetical protein Anas_12661 [Armadillidium nasatum]